MGSTCRLCGEESHVPLSCDEVEKDGEVVARTKLEDAMTEAMVRACVKCKRSRLSPTIQIPRGGGDINIRVRVVIDSFTPTRFGRSPIASASKIMFSRSLPCAPNSPERVKKHPVTPSSSLKLLSPFKPPTPTLPLDPSTPTFPLSSRVQDLLVARSRASSWLDMTPECAKGLEWDTVLEY